MDRLRTAGESVERSFCTDAANLAEAAETLQEVLGEHQDSVVARLALCDLGARIHLDAITPAPSDGCTRSSSGGG
ncbi:MAG: CHAD domain-containing protein [Nakamurella sp.]